MILCFNELSLVLGVCIECICVGRGIGLGLGKIVGRGYKGLFVCKGGGKIKVGFEGGQIFMQCCLLKIGFCLLIVKDIVEVLLYVLDKLLVGEIDFVVLCVVKLVLSIVKKVKVVVKGEVIKVFILKGIVVMVGVKVVIEVVGGSVME